MDYGKIPATGAGILGLGVIGSFSVIIALALLTLVVAYAIQHYWRKNKTIGE